MFSQTQIKNSIYCLRLTGACDEISCILCGEKEDIPFVFDADMRKNKKMKRAFIKTFEKKHINKCRKGK